MKNKILILFLILAVSLAVISSCSGAVSTGSSSGNEPPAKTVHIAEEVEPEEEVKAFDPVKVDSITFMGKTVIGLKLQSSNVNKDNGCVSHHYQVDGVDAEYVLDGNGKVISALLWDNSYTKVEDNEVKNLSLKDAQIYADTYISEFLGKDHSMTIVESYRRDSGADETFYFTYNDTIAGFRSDNSCRIIINAAGELFAIASSTPIPYDITDEDLAEYTDEYILAFVKDDLPGNAYNIELGDIWLLPDGDGGYELKVHVEYLVDNDKIENCSLRKYDTIIIPAA